jgi:tRNA1(Val) A37 N6-methylase TrmN6
MASEPEQLETTEDAVLGGRLRLRQPRRGHRVGHDAILLAAATPAYAGERAVDLGAGVGAAGLALAKRVEGARVTLVEIDPALCGLARENARLNGLDSRVDVAERDIAGMATSEFGQAARVLMNPPFNDPARLQTSPVRARRLAHVGSADTLTLWIGAAARLLVPGGTLTLIWRADGLTAVEAALAGAFADIRILPVLAQPSAPAIRILVRAEKGGRKARVLLPGLILNDSDGRPTPAAEAVLREGETLPLANF